MIEHMFARGGRRSPLLGSEAGRYVGGHADTRLEMRPDDAHDQEQAERRLHEKQARAELLRQRRETARPAAGKRHRHDGAGSFRRLRTTRRGR